MCIRAPSCLLPERTREGGSTLSTASQGDQAWKPVSCTSSVGLHAQVGLSPTGTPVYRNLPLERVPNGTSLGGRKIKVRRLGRSHFQPLHGTRSEPLSLVFLSSQAVPAGPQSARCEACLSRRCLSRVKVSRCQSDGYEITG